MIVLKLTRVHSDRVAVLVFASQAELGNIATLVADSDQTDLGFGEIQDYQWKQYYRFNLK
jgi:hypothetical protein